MTEKTVYRMSEVGYCAKRLGAIKLGIQGSEPPPWLMSSAEEGTEQENWIIRKLYNEGHTISDRQMEVSLDFQHFKLLGHIDGIITTNGVPKLLEI